jgi:hypothetical protein
MVLLNLLPAARRAHGEFFDDLVGWRRPGRLAPTIVQPWAALWRRRRFF